MTEQVEVPVIQGKNTEIGYKKPPRAAQFKPGQSGNPKGRPKGRSIKEMVRGYLENNPAEMERFVLHFVRKNRELAWTMLEGRPQQATEISIDKENLQELTTYFRFVATPKV